MHSGVFSLFTGRKTFFRKYETIVFIGSALFLIGPVATASEPARIIKELEFEVVDHARVVKASAKERYVLEGTMVIGDFMVLTKNDQQGLLQSAEPSVSLKPIKLASTGQIVLSGGRLVVQLVDANAGDSLAVDYGLDLVSKLSSISRVILQVPKFSQLQKTKAALELDYRVRSVELEVYRGGGNAQ